MKFQNPQQRRPPQGGPRPRMAPRRQEQEPRQFERLQATALYCPKCREATPAREFLLLVLPNGNLYDYRCAVCGTPTGSRSEKNASDVRIPPG